jgi:copper(I)-binding protein
VKKFVWLLLAVASPALAQIHIENAWSRATPPGAKIGVGYMTIRNASAAADKLLGASSPAAEKVETHITIRDGDISRMREVQGYDIPANGVFELKPGGAHLMLMNLKAPLKEGDKVPLVLKFERSGEVKVELNVEPMGGMRETHGPMGGHGR